jgi:hypothetical protein
VSSRPIVVAGRSRWASAAGSADGVLDASSESNRSHTMPSTTVGFFAGLLLGLALVLANFGDMLIVALFGAIGVVIVKVVDGDLDLGQLSARRRNDR